MINKQCKQNIYYLYGLYVYLTYVYICLHGLIGTKKFPQTQRINRDINLPKANSRTNGLKNSEGWILQYQAPYLIWKN